MRKNKTPTFTERSAAAAARQGAALSIFTEAADELAQAQVEQAALEADIHAEVESLLSQVNELEDHALAAFDAQMALGRQVNQIRSLAGLN